MDWIEDNKFIAGWIAVTVAGIVFMGMTLLKARAGYEDAYTRFAEARDQVHGLESKPLYPSAENVEKKSEAVGLYRKEVNHLHAELAALQRPLRNVEQTAFQSKLKTRIQKMTRDARRLGVGLPEGFSFGMPRYVNALPAADLCSLLDYQLDSISSLCSVLISKGIRSIESLNRAELPTEGARDSDDKKKNKSEEESVVQRFPLEIVFKTKPDGLREFLNVVSNPAPGAPFHIVRLVRIANQKQLGPLRGAGQEEAQDYLEEEGLSSSAVGASEDAVENLEELEGDGAEDSGLAFASKSISVDANEGLGAEDAEFVLGREEIEVYVKVELLRIAPPMAAEKSGEAPEDQGR